MLSLALALVMAAPAPQAQSLAVGPECATTGEAAVGGAPHHVPTSGAFRVLLVFVRWADDPGDPENNCHPDGWTANRARPPGASRFLAATAGLTDPMPDSSLTRFFWDQSNGNLRLYGTAIGYRSDSTQSWYMNPAAENQVARVLNWERLGREIMANLRADNFPFEEYDHNGDGYLDQMIVSIRRPASDLFCTIGTNQAGTGCSRGGVALRGFAQEDSSLYGIKVRAESIQMNDWFSIVPFFDNVTLWAHELGHQIGVDHLLYVGGNGIPDMTRSTGQNGYALMIGAGSQGFREDADVFSAHERMDINARRQLTGDARWIACDSLTTAGTYSTADLITAGGCHSIRVGTIRDTVIVIGPPKCSGEGPCQPDTTMQIINAPQRLLLSNVQRTSYFGRAFARPSNVGTNPVTATVCAPVEMGVPTTGLMVELSRGRRRDILPADNALAGWEEGTFDQLAGYGLSAEDVYGGDFWRPGVDRQITPWTTPNTYGYATLDLLHETFYPAGLPAIDDIRQGAGTDIEFDYYPSYPDPDVPVAYVRENWYVTDRTNGLATFNELRVLAGDTLFVEDSADVALTGNLVVEPGGALDLRGRLIFGPAGGLVVWGEMTADGGVMTAADSTLGWRGVRIERNALSGPGALPSGGPVTWANTTVSYASTPAGSLTTPAAVVVFDRHLSMAGGAIRNTETGSGLYVASGSAFVSNGAAIEDNGGHGIKTGAGGNVVIYADPGQPIMTITGNIGGGVSAAGQGGSIALSRATVAGNLGVGVEARAGGTVSFSATQRVTVTGNRGGLLARGGGDLFAGDCTVQGGQTVCTAPTIGHFLNDNTPDGAFYDARSVTGAVLYAEGNDWGLDDPSPDDLILVADAQSFLSVCPFVGGDAGACGIIGQRTAGLSGAAEIAARQSPGSISSLGQAAGRGMVSLSAPLFALASSRLVAGDTTGAVAAVTGALDAAQTEDERVGAYGAAARLAVLVQPAALVARLAAEALPEADPASRPWALRALVAAQTASGDAAGAHASASVLADGYAGTEHAAEGWSARVLLAVAADDEASALAAYDALVPLDSLGAAAAGDLIAAAFAGEDGGARLANRPAGGAETYAAQVASQTAGVPTEVEVGRVAPNPARLASAGSGTAALIVGLPVSSSVGVEVYDALGRRVWASPPSAHAAGYHRVVVAAGALAPGVYVARVRVTSPGEAPRVEARRFVVVR